MSRIGKKPITIPSGVQLQIKDNAVFVQGAKGEISLTLHPRIKLEVTDGQVLVKRVSDIKSDKALHGLYRALMVNMLKGVSQGYSKELSIVGLGYKAQVQGNNLVMQLGFSHPVVYPVPPGIKIETPKQTQIIIRGVDKEKVGEVAAELRAISPPEPYQGKGVRYAGEYIKKKVGKAQATSK